MMNRLLLDRKSGFSLVELLVTVVIVSMLAAVSAGIVIPVVKLFLFMPTDMKVVAVADEIIELMLEGDSTAPGLRYATRIVDASSLQITYTVGYPANNDKRNIKIYWSGSSPGYPGSDLCRTYTELGDPISGPQPPYINNQKMPYFATSDIYIQPGGHGGSFVFFKEDGSMWNGTTDSLDDISRIGIALLVQTTSAPFVALIGKQIRVWTAVDIKQYT